MPVSYTIDKQRHLVLTHCWGVFTDADMRAHKLKLSDDPDFCPTMGQLCDGRQIEQFAITTDGVRAMVEYDAANADRRRGHRVACVVPTDAAFGMVRMYGQRSAGGPQVISAFRSVNEAEAWLASAPRPENESN